MGRYWPWVVVTLLLLAGVLDRDGRLEHRLERDAQTLDEARDSWRRDLRRHQNTTFSTAVTTMLAKAIGIMNFHAIACS